ncbi:mCG1030502 [Mus musculus]|nr:mCG1030502 [Mus musculus]
MCPVSSGKTLKHVKNFKKRNALSKAPQHRIN